MKRLLLVFILMLSFQSLTKADDIRDFQIEGISVGDNLLDQTAILNVLKTLLKIKNILFTQKAINLCTWALNINQNNMMAYNF